MATLEVCFIETSRVCMYFESTALEYSMQCQLHPAKACMAKEGAIPVCQVDMDVRILNTELDCCTSLAHVLYGICLACNFDSLLYLTCSEAQCFARRMRQRACSKRARYPCFSTASLTSPFHHWMSTFLSWGSGTICFSASCLPGRTAIHCSP